MQGQSLLLHELQAFDVICHMLTAGKCGVSARLKLVDAVLAAGSKDVLRGLPGAVRIRQVLPLRRHTYCLCQAPET